MMETSTTNGAISEQLGSVDVELGMETSDGDFHFGYLTVESSADTCDRLGNSDELKSNELDEGSTLAFYETIPSLQDMASTVIAITLWRRVISLENSKRKTDLYPAFEFVHQEDENKVCSLLQDLPVPRLIRQLVKNFLGSVRSEMNEWARYYVQSVFTSKPSACEDPIKISDLMCCVWHPNGKIDYRKSALNMLSNSRLTFVDKFKIMCKYCFEDEIRKLPIKSIPERLIRKITFDKNPLIYYWICQMNDDLHTLPRRNGESVECFLITAFNVDTWSAVEYFWNRLTINEQLSKALVLINRKPQFQKELFSKMNEFQKCHVLSTMPFDITMNFWRQKSHERFAYLTWIRIKDTITYEQFTQLIYALLTESLPDHVEKLRYLVKMWNCCPLHLKNQALQPMKNTVVGLHSEYYSKSSCNLEFLLVFLSCGSAEFRKRVMFEQGDSLVLYNDFSMIDRLIDLCLPDANDVVEFKNFLLKSQNVRRHCCSMLDGFDRDHTQLISFLDHYCLDHDAKSEFINRILETWTIDGCSFNSLSKWNKMMEFINLHVLDTFPDQAIKFKKRIVWSFVHYCAELWSNDDELRKFIGVIDRVLDTEDLNKFKSIAFETLQVRYRWNQFDEEIIYTFLSWCFDNDDEKIREKKKSLSIDDMFGYGWEALKWNRHFGRDLSKQIVNMIFTPLDKMLLWYFENSDDAKNYKLRKVFDCGESRACIFIKYGRSIDEDFARAVLPWFFDGDMDEIRKFKEKFKNDAISKMIDIE